MPGVQRIVVSDRSSFVRALLSRLCQQAGHLVVGESASTAVLLELVDAEKPDLVITDVDLDDGPIEPILPVLVRSGLEVLVVCAHAAPDRLTPILDAGVSGYLLHDTAAAQLVEALQVVTGGAAALHPAVAAAILRQWRALRSTTGPGSGARSPLTPREIDVLAGMVDGLTTKAIARRLGVALKTVENHKLRIYDKLGARTQAHAVGLALAHGLLPAASAK